MSYLCIEQWLFALTFIAGIEAMASFAYMFGACVCVFNPKVIELNLHFRNAHSTQIQFIINESTTIMLNVQSIEFTDAHT